MGKVFETNKFYFGKFYFAVQKVFLHLHPMDKKKQIVFVEWAAKRLKDSGITLEHFLTTVEMSRTHWFFIKKAERPLTTEKEKIISEFVKKRCYAEKTN